MKGKTVLMALALLLAIGGSAFFYNILKDKFLPPDPLEALSESSVQTDSEMKPSSTEDNVDEKIKAPDFTVQDAEGNDIKLSDMLGKPIVLNFWASWCPPCKSEMPEFNTVFEEMGDDIHFMMVDAVDGIRETQEKGEEYISNEGYTFPVYFDIEQDAVTQYGIRAFPTSIFIDSEGYIIAGIEGAINEANLRKGIELIYGE